MCAESGLVVAPARHKKSREFVYSCPPATRSRSSFRPRVIYCLLCSASPLGLFSLLFQTVAAFPAHEAQARVKAATINRRAAAIIWPSCRGPARPTEGSSLPGRQGIRRTIGTAQKQKSPATAEIIGAMLSHCPKTTGGKRDRALLALGFAGAFRRSELATLTMDDLRHVAEGLQITIRKSKTDEESGGGRPSQSLTVVTSSRCRR